MGRKWQAGCSVLPTHHATCLQQHRHSSSSSWSGCLPLGWEIFSVYIALVDSRFDVIDWNIETRWSELLLRIRSRVSDLITCLLCSSCTTTTTTTTRSRRVGFLLPSYGQIRLGFVWNFCFHFFGSWHLCPPKKDLKFCKHCFASAVLCASLSEWAVLTSVDSIFVRFGVCARNNFHL